MPLVLLAGVLRVVRAGVLGVRDGGHAGARRVHVVRAGVRAGGGAHPYVRVGVLCGARPHVLVLGV